MLVRSDGESWEFIGEVCLDRSKGSSVSDEDDEPTTCWS